MELFLRLGLGWFAFVLELLGSFRCTLLGDIPGFAHTAAVSLDTDYVRVVHDAVDKCRGTGGIRENGVPVAKEQIRRQDETLLLVAPADDVE